MTTTDSVGTTATEEPQVSRNARREFGIELGARAPLDLAERDSTGNAGLHGRVEIIASKASASARILASTGIARPARPVG